MTMAEPTMRITRVTCPMCQPRHESYVYVVKVTSDFTLDTHLDAKGSYRPASRLTCHSTYYKCSRGHDWVVETEA